MKEYDEARTCYLTIVGHRIEHFLLNTATLNVIGIPDMNLWITRDNLTLSDPL